MSSDQRPKLHGTMRGATAVSRRDLLAVVTVASVATLPSVASPWDAAIAALPYAAEDEPVVLRRSKEGRELSKFRYRNAEEFFLGVPEGMFRQCRSDLLYKVGIVLQLGLSSHLLDVGFSDAWCARNIGLRVAKSLAYANATGLKHQSPEFEHLAWMLTPYWIWRNPYPEQASRRCLLSDAAICRLTRDLLDQVRHVTGHPLPRRLRSTCKRTVAP